jgi:MFS family permease
MAHHNSLSPPSSVAEDSVFGGSVFAEATARQWYVLAVLCLIYALNIADRYVISTLMESIKHDLHLTDTSVAVISGVGLALFYVTAGIPISWLADRYSRRNILAASLVIWSAMTVLTGLSRTFLQMLSVRVGVGVGESGGTPPSTSMLADYFRPRHQTAVLTIWSLGACVGAWLGQDVAGRVADAFDWRTAFLAMGVPGVVLGIVVFTTLREPRRGVMNDGAAKAAPAEAFDEIKMPLFTGLKVILSQPATMHLIVGSALTALWGWGLMWWMPTYLQRSYHMTTGEAGAMLGPMQLIAGSLATVGTGLFMATPFMANPKRVLQLMALVVGCTTVPSFFIFWTHDLLVTKICLWILVPAMYFYIGPCFGLINNLVAPHLRAMASAVTLLVANICNLVIAPMFVGMVSDYIGGAHGGDAASLRIALLMLAPTGFWAAWHYWAATQRIDAETAARVAS